MVESPRTVFCRAKPPHPGMDVARAATTGDPSETRLGHVFVVGAYLLSNRQASRSYHERSLTFVHPARDPSR
jgi:hypothetical protein